MTNQDNLMVYGRWAFAEFTDIWQLQDDFATKVEAAFTHMIDDAVVRASAAATGQSLTAPIAESA